jgi:hypothetical protein
MAAVYVSNLVVNAGTDFSQTFTLEDTNSSSAYDLTSATVSAQMRKHSGSSTAIDFTTTIVVPKTSGQIILQLTDSQTADIKPGRYVYDVIVTIGSTKTRVVEGMVLVREGVTR